MSKENGPRSIGIILDGNRRWAKENGLPQLEGHRRGAEKLKEVVQWAKAHDVQFLTAYAFSTENWKRSPEEVAGLMGLFEEALSAGLKELAGTATIRFIGERERLSERAQALMSEMEHASAQNSAFTLVIALSYGGRADIVRAANIASTQGTISEESLGAALSTAGVPDPDLIIRTGGTERLSNFLPWESIYSELVFTPTLWPALTEEEFSAHLDAYQDRKRNFGV